MSEMSEVNRTLPSLNGGAALPPTTESFENGASMPLKTTIPMQEVSAAREEPAPAAAHYLPSDDRATAAAASAASQENHESAMNSMPGGEVATKLVFEGPGHEADIRDRSGGNAEQNGKDAERVDSFQVNSGQSDERGTLPSDSLPDSSRLNVVSAPGSQNSFNESEEKSLGQPILTQSETELPTPTGSLAPAVEVRQEPSQTALPKEDALAPSIDAVSESKENVLSPVKIDGEAQGYPVSLPAPSTTEQKPVISAIDHSIGGEAAPSQGSKEPGQASAETSAQSSPPSPEVQASQSVVQEDVQMKEEPSAAPAVVSSEEIAAPAVVKEDEGRGQSASQEEEEPPSKRQRKSVSLGHGGNDESKTSLAGPESTSMTTQQISFCQKAIKALRTRPEAGPFLAPVDYVALNLPHYPQLIKEPKDLGTIDVRLAITAAAQKGGNKPTEKTKQAAKFNLDPVRDVYQDVEVFERDVRLVFSNCATFNGPDHPVTASARTLEGVFDKQMKNFHAPVTPAATAASEATTFDTPVTPVNGSSARRPSDVASRPKRDIHPPAPKDLPWSDRPQSAPGTGKKKKAKRPMTAREEAQYAKVFRDQVKFFLKFIDDLHKSPTLSAFAWVFYEKPSMDLDFAPTYYSLIKNPISLKEIKERLVKNEYDNIENAKEDFDLMLNNCFTFNEPHSDVWTMGKEVQKAWEIRQQKMPQPAPIVEDDEEEEDEEDEEEKEAELQARLIREQIANLQAQLEGLSGNSKAQGAKALASAKASLAAMPGKKAVKKRRPSESSGSTKKTSTTKKAKATTGGSASAATGSSNSEPKKAKAKRPSESNKRRDDDVRDVTYEQKEELAAKITQLPDDRLDGALKIISEDKPASANDDEEIELDIDDLSPATLYKLYRYVVRPKGKKPPSKVSSSDGRKRGTGGVKRKNLDEGEEAARIARLQEQLQQFNNPDAAASASSAQGGMASAGAHDDLVASESSSGEEESDSESEFE